MCLLSFFSPGVQPVPEHLAAGAAVNRDGYGYAIVHSGTLIVRKNLRSGPLIEEFARMRRQYPDGPAMFHSRMGTSGIRGLYNCHPFFLSGDSLTVIGHNGILWGHRWGDRRCDTRQFAEGLLPSAFGDLDEYSMKLTLEEFLGYNKLVILTVNPRYEESYYILNEDRGNWIEGAWHSNSDYMSRRDLHRRRPSWADEEETRCDICLKAGSIDADTNSCMECGCCQDCYEHNSICLCHSVRNHSVPAATVPSVPVLSQQAVQARLALVTGTENS